MLKFPNFNNKVNFLHSITKKFLSDKIDTVTYNQHNRFVTEITLNNPKALNSLDMSMIKSLLKNCRRWLPENDPQEPLESLKEETKNNKQEVNTPKVVLMSGAGPKSFCAGGDVVSIYNLKKQNKPVSEVSEFFKYLLI
jgi:enoyl-CoA hydratase/carnithine racemase